MPLKCAVLPALSIAVTLPALGPQTLDLLTQGMAPSDALAAVLTPQNHSEYRQVTAEALASENKALAHPHSVDSLPTSANQEDHVSMAPAAGKRLWEMAENTRGVLAVEWLAACQGLDLRDGLKTSPALEKARGILRDKVAFYEKDRFFAPDINAASELLASRCLNELVPAKLLPSL